MSSYKITTDVFTLPYEENKKVLYAPLLGFVCEVNNDMINFLANLENINEKSLKPQENKTLEYLIDKRVVNMERTNISDIKPEQLDPKPIFATVDLSYLSLTKAIPIVSCLLERKGEMLCLVKPLFEVPDPEARRTGKIDSPEMYREILHRLIDFVGESGLCPAGITHSHVTGNKGTREFFLLISLDTVHLDKAHLDIDHVVRAAMKVPVFQRE